MLGAPGPARMFSGASMPLTSPDTVAGPVTVRCAQAPRDPGAAGRDGGRAGVLDEAGAHHVPGIRQDERRPAPVQRAKSVRGLDRQLPPAMKILDARLLL